MKKATYTKTVPIGQVKKDSQFVSICKAWDKLNELHKKGLLILESGCGNWMRYKHTTKNKFIQLSGNSRLINLGKENEDFLETLTITFYNY